MPPVVGVTKIFARHLHVLLTLILLYTIASTIVINKKHFWSDYYILVILCLSAQYICAKRALNILCYQYQHSQRTPAGSISTVTHPSLLIAGIHQTGYSGGLSRFCR